MPFGTLYIEHHLHRLINRNDPLTTIIEQSLDVDGHGLPICIEKLVAIEQRSNSGVSFAGQQLEKRGQVFCAYHLMRKCPMQQVGVSMRPLMLEDRQRSCGSSRVNEIHGCTEQAREGVVERDPALKRAVFSIIGNQKEGRFQAPSNINNVPKKNKRI